MKVSGKIVDATIDFKTNKPRITFEVNEREDFYQLFDEHKDMDKLSIEVKQYRQKRSLDANAYCWVLISKIAERLRLSKEAVYREHIRNIGGNSETVCVKTNAVDRLCEGWRNNGIGWQTETFPSKIKGCTNVVLYYGSSDYDSLQMHLLLENLIQDCKTLGIQTETPDQIALMKARWGE